MNTPQRIEALTTMRRQLERCEVLVEEMRLPHNYCFTVSDDEVCDVGLGDCREWLVRLHQMADAVRAAMRWVREQERL
jgi:hypothetical protein